MRKLAKDCLTENNGESYDFGRVTLVLFVLTGLPTFIACVFISVVWPDHHFDMIAYGTAFGGMLAGVATVIGTTALKQKTDT